MKKNTNKYIFRTYNMQYYVLGIVKYTNMKIIQPLPLGTNKLFGRQDLK